MIDYNSNEDAFPGFSESRYAYEPPVTYISLKHINEVYKACENAQNTNLSKSEKCLNASTFSLGAASIIGLTQRYIFVVLLFVLAIILYILYLFARKEEGNDIIKITDNIMKLMPLSKEETVQAMLYDQEVKAAKIESFIKHTKSPYKLFIKH